MFIIAFALVIGYQIYKRKTNTGNENEDENSLLSKFSKGKKLTPKAQNDLKEIEKMMG